MLRQSILKGNRKGGDPRLSTETKSAIKRIKSTEKLSDLNAPEKGMERTKEINEVYGLSHSKFIGI